MTLAARIDAMADAAFRPPVARLGGLRPSGTHRRNRRWGLLDGDRLAERIDRVEAWYAEQGLPPGSS